MKEDCRKTFSQSRPWDQGQCQHSQAMLLVCTHDEMMGESLYLCVLPPQAPRQSHSEKNIRQIHTERHAVACLTCTPQSIECCWSKTKASEIAMVKANLMVNNVKVYCRIFNEILGQIKGIQAKLRTSDKVWFFVKNNVSILVHQLWWIVIVLDVNEDTACRLYGNFVLCNFSIN